jgi:hypothetical protein
LNWVLRRSHYSRLNLSATVSSLLYSIANQIGRSIKKHFLKQAFDSSIQYCASFYAALHPVQAPRNISGNKMLDASAPILHFIQ